MLATCLAFLSALCLAAAPSASAPNGLTDAVQDEARQDSVSAGRSQTSGQSYGDRNRGGPRGFYSYPRARHVDSGTFDRLPPFRTGADTSPYCGHCHGSAYYGRDYGAPYFGGGYYDRGVYYRERRD